MTTPNLPPLPDFEPQYRCHIDCFDGQEPDECAWDIGRPQDCIYTRNHGADGKKVCGEWRPIKDLRDSYTAGMMRDYALAAYRAGAEEMRERAARVAEDLGSMYIQGGIRALPLDDQP